VAILDRMAGDSPELRRLTKEPETQSFHYIRGNGFRYRGPFSTPTEPFFSGAGRFRSDKDEIPWVTSERLAKLAGPNWKREEPAGLKEVIRCETHRALPHSAFREG
jgi:hypothetical protein